MAETLSLISKVSFALAGVFAILAIILWFKFKIPKIIGDLSGRTAKKSIAQMRENNEKTGKKSFRPSSTNQKRGKLTEPIGREETERLKKQEVDMPKTELLAENQANTYSTEPETELLAEEGATELLFEENATQLLSEEGATELLGDEGETTLLDNYIPEQERKRSGQLVMLKEIICVHTDEKIGR